MAKYLHIDIETYSPVSLPDCGLYKYANESRILLVAYAFENEPVQIIDLAQGEELPQWFIDALQDPGIIKIAHNAAFELERIEQTFSLSPKWALGLPLSGAGYLTNYYKKD